MIAIIDNYDSFTYNLYQYLGELNSDIEVYRNDKISVAELLEKAPSQIILSPGPGYPASAGICVELIRANKSIPMLGVCLGHQAIAEAFGGEIVHAPRIMHGKQDCVELLDDSSLFAGLPKQLEVGRYHSLVARRENLPEELRILAQSDDGCIMAFVHRALPIYGIQFHPESVLTPSGKALLKNFLAIKGV